MVKIVPPGKTAYVIFERVERVHIGLVAVLTLASVASLLKPAVAWFQRRCSIPESRNPKITNRRSENVTRSPDIAMVELQREKTRPRSSAWRRVLTKQAREFCLSTGLHGYKYIAQSQRSIHERAIWAVGVAISLCCAIALMQIAWEYNTSHLTLTVIESTHHGIWNYRFPAVTICDLNRVSLSRAQDLVNSLQGPRLANESAESLVAEMRLLNRLLNPDMSSQNVYTNLKRLQKIFDDNKLTIPDVMKMVTRNCSEITVRCKWKGKIISCDSIFESSLSRDGICCSFNYLGVPDRKKSGRIPKRVTACGFQTGLSVMLNLAPLDYHATLFGGYGLKVILHDPYDYPDRNAASKLIRMDEETFLSVTPEVTYSTNDVRNLPLSKRSCIFSDEGEDLIAPPGNYSYHNCLSICRLQTIWEKCGCIPYYHKYLRFASVGLAENDANINVRICNLTDVKCVYDFRDWYETSWPGTKVTNKNLPPVEILDYISGPCKCIPDCNLFSYPLESSSGILDRSNAHHDLAFYKDVDIKNHSILHVFFSDLVSTQYRRDVYYNWHNLFASFGGLLGLFAGFSLMSAFELIYFFSIRLIADLWTGDKKERI
ncbi:sodium channel protein Nach-like [Diprion similis]|uniref:sodium channel protein Nach-like n=1 Tax=Diprion similis TaxID=362088 RepID=UPI001EF9947F|nr:sodium channel protein Nach-like [Diprion similis]